MLGVNNLRLVCLYRFTVNAPEGRSMKLYYIGGIVGGIVLGLLLWGIVSMASCSKANKITGKYEDNEVKHTYELRYFMDDDYDNAEVVYIRVHDGSNYSISRIPTKAGYNFVGLYDGPDSTIGVLYVGTDGHGLMPLTRDILLYPVFEKIGG